MEKSIPLNDWCVKKWDVIINRLHFLIHGIGVLFLFHYRVRALIWSGPVLGHVLMFVSELSLTLLWLLGQGFKWRPVRRTVYPQRLPADEKLPSLDVFICTADPTKEPTLIVMNTLISAMALHYPPNKLHVYLSDDAGSSLTFRATKEACNFAKLWIPFCNRYHLNNRCPQGYFQEGLLSNNPQFILCHAPKPARCLVNLCPISGAWTAAVISSTSPNQRYQPLIGATSSNHITPQQNRTRIPYCIIACTRFEYNIMAAGY